MLIYKGTLNNVFKRSDFTDKVTGQTKFGKYQLEFITKREVIKGQGFETVLERISIPESEFPKYKNSVGKDVEVNVGAMANKNNVVLFGL